MLEITINKNIGQINLNFSINIKKQSFISLTGPSGSGKTTTLRIIAGLEDSNSTIKFNNTIFQDKNTFLAPQKRNIGFVFQNYALFPNMNILDNLLFVNNDINLANHLLQITELNNIKYQYPNTLSGGQKQRVAIARAFIQKPDILLLDEPFNSLDYKIKNTLIEKLYLLHKEFKTTTIMVSHDYSDIYRLSDKILKLENGSIKYFNKQFPNKIKAKLLDNNTILILENIVQTDKLDIFEFI